VFCNCHDLSARTHVGDPSYATSLSFFGGRHMNHGAHGGGMAVCVDLTPALGRMANPQSLNSDRLTVQLFPAGANGQSRATVIRPQRVEIVII
jgi:hypothetical protein